MQGKMTVEFCPRMNVIREVGNKDKREDVASVRRIQSSRCM